MAFKISTSHFTAFRMNNIWSVKNHMKHCEYEPESLQRNIIQAAPFNAWNKAEPNHFSNYWCHFSAQSELRWIHVWRASAQKNLNLLSLYLTFSDLNFLPFCIPSNCICIIFQLTLHSLPDLRRKGKSQPYKHTRTQRTHTDARRHTQTTTAISGVQQIPMSITLIPMVHAFQYHYVMLSQVHEI